MSSASSAASHPPSQPHHRREDAELMGPSSESGTQGPVVAMKATDLDALSPRSAANPPNFLEYAQAGAADIQAQMPAKDSSAMESASSGDKSSLTEKLGQGWEAAKEKISDAWNNVGAKTATASQERVNQMKGGNNNNNNNNYPLTSTPDSDTSIPNLRPQGPSSHTNDMSSEGRATREQEQRAREAEAVSSSNSNIQPTNATNELNGSGDRSSLGKNHNTAAHTNISLSSTSGVGSENTSTHSLNSTKIGEDGQEHVVQSSYTIREVPLPDGKVEVREQWADREDDQPVKVKQVRRVVDPQDLDKI